MPLLKASVVDLCFSNKQAGQVCQLPELDINRCRVIHYSLVWHFISFRLVINTEVNHLHHGEMEPVVYLIVSLSLGYHTLTNKLIHT